jgi:dipeptidyl aminopeptidase/acylaminoacyl peptidase
MKNLITLLIILSISSYVKGQADKIEFISEGIKLNTYFYEGVGAESMPTLIWLHGNPGGKEDGKARWAKQLNQEGINVLQFNYQGLWGNEGEFSLGNALKDLSNAMDLLTSEKMLSKYQIDTTQIYVGGFSFGASAALIGAMYDERINKIIATGLCDHSYFGRQFMDPNSKLRAFIEESMEDLFLPNGIIKQDKEIFIKDLTDNIYKYNFVAQADKFTNKELYIFTGLNDYICPIEDHLIPFYRRLKELNHKNLEVTIEICGHGFNCETPISMAEVLTNWIKK